MANLELGTVLSQFDQLRADGELFWTPAAPLRIEDEGLDFELRIVPSFNSKPNLAHPEQTAQSARRPPPSDGSDIDHSDPAFFVAYAPLSSSAISPFKSAHSPVPSGATHKLILNKFNVHRPQYLLLSTNPRALQSSPLDATDLRAAWDVLTAASSPHYVIFNCGKEAGSSRRHKHLQVLGMPELEDPECHGGKRSRSLMWPNIDVARQDGETLPGLPFVHHFAKLCSSDPRAIGRLVTQYEAHVCRSRQALGLQADEILHHNVILTKDWCITIPRRAASIEGIRGHVVGAQGMLGMLWLGNEDHLRGWKESGMKSTLAQLGVPSH